MSPLPPLGFFSKSGVVAGDFESIQTYTVGAGGASSITFDLTSVTGYKHLQLRMITRGASSDDSVMRFNSDSGSNYRWHILEGNGSSAYASNSGGSASTQLYVSRTVNGATTGSGIFTVSVMDILDYANTSKNKVIRTLDGNDRNGSGTVTLWSGLWMSTSAITSINLAVQSGNYAEYSSFALYGIKG